MIFMDKKTYVHSETGEKFELTDKEYYLFPKNVMLKYAEKVVKKKAKKLEEKE